MNESTKCIHSKEDDNDKTNTNDEKQWKQNNSTKTNLMSLPNELFDYFLIYLSPCDIVQSLNGINQRLNFLIYPFIHKIDVSTKKKSWINKYLSSICPFITTIKFNHSQLQILFPTLTTIDNQYPSLKSIIWNYQFGNNDYLCLSYLNIFRTRLLSLSFNLIANDDDEIDNNYLALLLLHHDSLIEELIFKYKNTFAMMWFSLKPNTLKLNEHLKRLTIKLHHPHDLFILIENLSQLEYLNVEICEIDKNIKYNYTNIRNKTARLSPFLKELIIDSLDFTFNHLLLLLEQFQQSIELLTLTMSIDDQINGEILISTILSKLSKLKQFQFIFRMTIHENININTGLDKLISTFRLTSYWLTHPVMCYHERCIPCFTICSLPWLLKQSDSLTNEIINHRINTTMPLQINYIKSIFLAGTTITFKFIKFIKETFVNLNKMIISWHTCTLDYQVIIEIDKIKLNTVKTLKYYGVTDDLDYIDFLLLTPNIRCLIVDGSTIHIINSYAQENEQLASICEQINDLNIFRNFSDCDKDETEATFPNALISSKDI